MRESSCFAGLGLALNEPGFHLRIHAAKENSVVGPATQLQAEYTSRVESVLQRNAHWARPASIEIVSALPLHAGLGAGTQLGAAVAAGLHLFQAIADSSAPNPPSDQWHQVVGIDSASECLSPLNIHKLVELSGRGLRSAIGLYGFLHGGLILDEGNSEPGNKSRSFSSQLGAIPDKWRIVLIRTNVSRRVFGDEECQRLKALGVLPNPHQSEMMRLARLLITENQSFEDFTHRLESYMDLGALLFSGVQGGKYNGEVAIRAVQCARELGLQGVGQSSWGPTLFGFAPSENAAEHFLSDFRRDPKCRSWTATTVSPSKKGAQWRWQGS
ncbi:MAG: hypothetical protein KDB22_11915 [Planctomycetales bacterium]|nr:hypothetical protein [Planctomycetales bacterium]